MQNVNSSSERVVAARREARTASHLEWGTRVLLAAAEAVDASLPRAFRTRAPRADHAGVATFDVTADRAFRSMATPMIACVIADKACHELADARTVRHIRDAVVTALVAAGIARYVPAHVVTRIAWRLLFDLTDSTSR